MRLFLLGESIMWEIYEFSVGFRWERTWDQEMFLVPVASRDKVTLMPIIRERIGPGTIIMSDCWAA
jgi:hypothetical protein